MSCTLDHLVGDIYSEYRLSACLRNQTGRVSFSASEIQHMFACHGREFLQYERSGREIREDHGLLPGPLVCVLIEHSSDRIGLHGVGP
jgi:hypothetical protein